MEDRQKISPAEPRSKYVWDKEKLAWVEEKGEAAQGEIPAEEAPAQEIASAEVSAAENKSEEVLEGAPSESVAVEPEEEKAASPYKGAWSRLGAFVIDMLVLLVIYFILNKTLGSGSTDITAEVNSQDTMVAGILLGIMFIYLVGFWSWRGQTLGKRLVGARIVKADGSRAGVIRLFVRFLVFMVYFIVLYLASAYVAPALAIFLAFLIVLSVGIMARKRGIHDIVAGTVVINTRIKVAQTAQAEASEAYEETSITTEDPEPADAEVDKQE